MSNTSTGLNEALLSINEFIEPTIIKNEEAAYLLIIRLFLLEPGTNQTHPDMGIGIRSKYRFSDSDDIAALRREAKLQIETYLPDLLIVDVQIQAYGTTLAIFLSSSNNSMYALGYDTNTTTMAPLTLDDIKQ